MAPNHRPARISGTLAIDLEEMLSAFVVLLCCIVAVSAADKSNPLSAVTKADKLRKLAELVNSTMQMAVKMDFMPSSTPHNFSSPEVIMASALSKTYISTDALHFVGTARKSGFKGDIVVACLEGATDLFMKKLLEHNATIYIVKTACNSAVPSDIRCTYGGRPDVPVGFFKYYFFQYWSLMYPSSTYFMASDFRDVIFQSNPFNYKSSDWRAPQFQLTVFQESHPNRVINRCPVTGVSLQNCYDTDVFRSIGSNTISTSGVVFGTRDAIAGYSFLVSKQYEPKNGRGHNQTSNEKCLGFSSDLTFHNYLLYTNYLSKFMNIKIFQQGEGPANTLGGFYGERKILKALLSEWKILRGESPYKYVHNWNGELSPVVHQLDRFATSELAGGYKQHLAVMQHL